MKQKELVVTIKAKPDYVSLITDLQRKSLIYFLVTLYCKMRQKRNNQAKNMRNYEITFHISNCFSISSLKLHYNRHMKLVVLQIPHLMCIISTIRQTNCWSLMRKPELLVAQSLGVFMQLRNQIQVVTRCVPGSYFEINNNINMQFKRFKYYHQTER